MEEIRKDSFDAMIRTYILQVDNADRLEFMWQFSSGFYRKTIPDLSLEMLRQAAFYFVSRRIEKPQFEWSALHLGDKQIPISEIYLTLLAKVIEQKNVDREQLLYINHLFLGTSHPLELEKSFQILGMDPTTYVSELAQILNNLDPAQRYWYQRRTEIDQEYEKAREIYESCERIAFHPAKLIGDAEESKMSLEEVHHWCDYYLEAKNFKSEFAKSDVASHFSQARLLKDNLKKVNSENAWKYQKMSEASLEESFSAILYYGELSEYKDTVVWSTWISHIVVYAYHYLSDLSVEEQQSICQDLQQKFALFYQTLEYLKDPIETDHRENPILLAAQELVEQFAFDSFHSRKDFCQQQGIPFENFLFCVELLQKYSPDDYSIYLQAIKQQNIKRFAILSHTTTQIIDYLREGVVLASGETRAFSVTDYFHLTKLTKQEFLSITGKLPVSDQRLLSSFFRKLDSSPTVSLKNIQDSHATYSYLKDGQVKTATTEDISLVVSYMTDPKVNLPAYSCIFKDLLRAQVLGTLDETPFVKTEVLQKCKQKSKKFS